MERFMQRENVLLGYSPQRSIGNPNFGPRTPLRTSDVDFHDVFGGPPRRYSSQEIRYSFGETMESTRGVEDATLSLNPWSGLSEKPVFGDETVSRRRYPSDDFFGDIFRGDESHSSPRRSDRDLFCSSPGSRVLSPVRPLPPKAEPLGSSLPAQFSLPAKLTKVDLPTFGTGNQSSYKPENGASNGINFSYTSNTSLSRFSSQSIQGQDELKNDIQTSSHQSHLSHEFPSKESSLMIKSDETDRSKFVKDSESAEAPNIANQFHFSIYKWASKGVPVPLMMPLRRGNNVKLKENGTIERCSSSNGRIENERLISELLVGNGDSAEMEGEKQKRVSLLKRNTHDKVDTFQIVEETVLPMPGLNSLNSFHSTTENISHDSVVSNKREQTEPPFPEVGLCEKTEKESCAFSQGACKPELKPLYSLLDDDHEQEDDEMTIKDAGKGNMVKTTEATPSNVKHDPKGTNSNRAEVNKASSHHHSVNLIENHGRNGIKGKVKEFVKIFNQEASSKPKINVDTQSHSSRWKSRHNYGADCEGNVSRSETHGKMHRLNVNKMKTVNTNFEQLEKQHSHIKATFHERSVNSYGHENASVWSFESLADSNKRGNIEDPSQDNFQIKELSHDQEKEPQTDKDYDDLEVSDVKIRQWSNGKAGNIRSLLSTLQYVLWPESGWKPVPLVDLIEGSAVKRAYQKALLCLHPDKLQQKGVASHQKYIAEKVFDILQEAWDHFNSLGSL